eukprot:364508-Chlamydomonas_euryale.AAC.9
MVLPCYQENSVYSCRPAESDTGSGPKSGATYSPATRSGRAVKHGWSGVRMQRSMAGCRPMIPCFSRNAQRMVRVSAH